MLSLHQVLLLYSWLLNVLPEAAYCCFSRTTSFTTMFTVIIVMCSLNGMCVSSFIVIGYFVSDATVMYCLRLFIVVLQELHCLPNCLHVDMIRV